MAGLPALVGPQVVSLFRTCSMDDLFETSPVIMTESFRHRLNPTQVLQPIQENVDLDRNLPRMTFYPHPSFAHQQHTRTGAGGM